MTMKSLRAALTATFLAATATSALMAGPARAADEPKVSREVGQALMAVQKDLQNKDYQAAVKDFQAAKQVSDRTPFDDYKIAQFGVYVYVPMKDMANADANAEAAADSPAMPDADKPQQLKTALILATQVKHYDKAVTYAKALQATNPTDPAVLSNIADAYYNGKDYADAEALVQKQIDADIAAGKRPDRNSLEILLSAQVGQKDEAGAEKTLEQLVAYYNDPNDWTQMIDVAFGTKGLRDLDAVWLGRLMFVCGAAPSPQDASIVGQTASHLTFFGDAVLAQQHGGTGFPDPTPRANADKKTIQQQIAAGARQGGEYNVKLAEALYSYGMYPEAEAAAQAAITKGGTKDPSEAPMVLGQAQLAQNKFDDAIASFQKVTGGGPATPRIVRLWIDYANIKKNPPPAATAAAAPAQQPQAH